MTNPISRLAPAKINLMLHVVGRFPDGYHHLQSLVAFSSIGDIISVEKAEASQLTLEGPFASQVPLDANNSVVRAAKWIKERFPEIGQTHIHLTKNLPIAAGIGGGTADAAATVAALLALHEIPLSPSEEDSLILASGTLGADVPLSLAHQFGRGPLLWIDSSGRESLPLPIPHSLLGVMVLVNPSESVSTATIFQQFQPPYTPSQDFHLQGDLTAYLKNQRNDLTELAVPQAPKIQNILQILEESECLLARMSGTGATCFGLFADEQTAQHACERLSAEMPQAWVVRCES